MSLTPELDPFKLAKTLSGKHLIGGKLVPAKSSKTFDVDNPATGDVIGTAAFGTKDDVADAVACAKAAQKEWAKMAARSRGKLVAECGRVLTNHVEELGRLVALETGKALRTESRIEAGVLADMFTFFGGLGSELKGETIPFNPDMLTVTVREPVGVVACIIPWNVPLLLMAMKAAAALVAGNSVVVKSAEEAPLTVLRVAEIMNTVLPHGLFNMLSGFGPECGAPLVEHPDVKKVSFTGSVETGRIVYRAAAEKLIPVTLELGGKSPMIVCADADMDQAVAGALAGMRFTRQGQSCTASSRLFVHASIHDEFIARVKAKVDTMVMGDPLDEKTDIGTIVSDSQLERVKSYIKLGEETKGVTKHACSAMPTDPKLAKGRFVQPVIFTGLKNSDRICQEEIFGPVCAVIKWTDYEDVIAQANDSEYGLAASIWTRDFKIAMDATKRLEAGFVQVNQNLVVQPGLSYGGVKTSGLGREASLESMLEHFTHKKTIIFNMK